MRRLWYSTLFSTMNSTMDTLDKFKNSHNGKLCKMMDYCIICIISECNCNVEGSLSYYSTWNGTFQDIAPCDNNGQCRCKAGFFGTKCEEGTIFIIL